MMEKSLYKKPTKISFKESGSASHRRRSTAAEENVIIEDLKLGESFSIALSTKGMVYTWGMNDKGQLGIGNETPTLEP